LIEDEALQLVLIVDYIMDWARDVYRIAILRQLKSMVTGQPFDQISLAYSTMSSMRRDVSRWIPAPPSTVLDDLKTASESEGHEDKTSSMPLDHQALLDIQIPNTKLGSLRSASKSDRRFACLYLTEGLLPSFLQVIAGRRDNKDSTEKAARQIINFVTQFDDVLVMSKGDLDMIESLWTGKAIASDPDEVAEEFYVVMEASWYFNPSWELTKELSCLAITKSAFSTLKTYAKFKVRHKGIESLPQCERRCTKSVLRQCIECLRSGSPWQTLLSAISCTVVTIYPLPTRRRHDFIPPVDVLGFGYVKYSQVRSFMNKFLKKNLWKPREIEKIRIKNSEVMYYMSLGYTRREVFEMRTEKPPKHTDPSWKRISEQTVKILEEYSHVHENCERCTMSPESNISPYAHGFLDTRNEPSLSGYNAVLVVSLHEHERGQYKTDACVFALGEMQELAGNTGLSIMIEDLLQRGLIYHTIMSATNDVSPTFDFRGNLPLPYRSVTSEERYRLETWIKELRDEPLSTSNLDRRRSQRAESHEAESTYRLMYLLGIGHSEEEATILSEIDKSNLDSAVYSEKSPGDPLSFKKIKLCGETPAERFTSWDEGKEFLRREHPKQISYMESISTREVIVLD
jgi:hypothetical protein